MSGDQDIIRAIAAVINDNCRGYSWIATRIFAALRGKYAIIQLPEPNPSGTWSINAKGDMWVEDNEVCRVLPQSSGSTISICSPDTMRKIAGAYLAAADKADGITTETTAGEVK